MNAAFYQIGGDNRLTIFVWPCRKVTHYCSYFFEKTSMSLFYKNRSTFGINIAVI
jgi:hypothetical protein